MIDTAKLHDAMSAHGVEPSNGLPPLVPGEFVRFSTNGKRSDAAGWVRLFPDQEGAAFGDWRGDVSEFVFFDDEAANTADPGEIRARRLRAEEQRRLAEQDKAEQQDRAAARALEEWGKAAPVDSHDYLTAKGLTQGHGTRVDSAGRLVVLVVNEDGEATSLQRITPNGSKRFLPDGSTKGGRYWLRGPDEGDKGAPLVLVEGFATGASIAEALPWPVCAAFNAGNLLAVAESIHAMHPDRLILVAGDEDNTGRPKAQAAADTVGGAAVFPPFTESSTGTDWNDYAQAKGRENVAKLLTNAASNATQPEPVDLFGNLETPEFPTNLLPDTLARFAADQGELMGTDPGLIGMSCLTALAACLDDGIKIQPKRHDPTWTESARLWFSGIGGPSILKSPAQGKVMRPIKAIDREWSEDADKARAEYERARKKWAKAEKDHVEKDGPDPGPEPELPEMRRLVYSDVTVEKLAAMLAEHTPRGCLIYRDELSGWLSGMDAYKAGGSKDRAAWLEAFNGGGLSVDRVNRGSLYVENWSACVLGGIQPDVIHKYANATDHDGMIQRFLVLYARPAGMGVDRPADMEAVNAYGELARKLTRLEPSGNPVKLSEDAHKVREALWEKLHRLTVSHPNQHLAAWLGKGRGTYARLLLTFHAIECAEREIYPSAEPVSGDTAQRVADLMTGTLLPHAVRFYGGMDPAGDHADKVARLILAKGWERFTVKRDLDRNLRESSRWKPWEIDEALARLDSFGWIVPVPGKMNERGTPSAYTVNARVHQRFSKHAQAERERREEVAKMMGELSG